MHGQGAMQDGLDAFGAQKLSDLSGSFCVQRNGGHDLQKPLKNLDRSVTEQECASDDGDHGNTFLTVFQPVWDL